MSTGKALVIDDEKNIRLTLSKCLKYIDLEVSEAINGEEGLKKLKDEEYDIIFLDLKMQGMGGLETLKKIKEVRPNVPVVIVTAHGTVDAAVDAMKLGAADFMQKPFTPNEIQDKVKDVLSRENLEEDSLDTFDAYLQFAKQLIVKKKYNDSLEFLKKAIGLDPGRAEPHNIIGAIMEIRGELPEAKKYYSAALALKPGFKQAQKNLDRVNEKLKNTKAG